MVGLSADGRTVLFHDAGVYDPLYLWNGDAVRVIADAGYEPGTPIFGRLSPSEDLVVFDDTGHLFRYDIDARHVSDLPDPGGIGVAWYAFISETSLAVVTATRGDVIAPPTQLWTVDLGSPTAVPLSTRTDADIVYSTTAGVVVQVDLSAKHDGSHLALYLIDANGSDSLLYDAGDVVELLVSPDGTHVAFSSTVADQPGSWIVTLSSGDNTRLDSGGSVWSFSPDSRHVAVHFQDGHVTSYALDGSMDLTQTDGDAVGWVGSP